MIIIFLKILGKACVFLHHYGVPIIANWVGILNSYGRKKDLRQRKIARSQG